MGRSDIPLFVNTLLSGNPSPGTTCTGDLNQDSVLNGRDIQPFAQALLVPRQPRSSPPPHISLTVVNYCHETATIL